MTQLICEKMTENLLSINSWDLLPTRNWGWTEAKEDTLLSYDILAACMNLDYIHIRVPKGSPIFIQIDIEPSKNNIRPNERTPHFVKDSSWRFYFAHGPSWENVQLGKSLSGLKIKPSKFVDKQKQDVDAYWTSTEKVLVKKHYKGDEKRPFVVSEQLDVFVEGHMWGYLMETTTVDRDELEAKIPHFEDLMGIRFHRKTIYAFDFYDFLTLEAIHLKDKTGQPWLLLS